MATNALAPGWSIWFHGTTKVFGQFEDRYIGGGNDCNTALGHWLAARIAYALQYVEHSLNRGGVADVIIVGVSRGRTYAASQDEFWCRNETPLREDEFDPQGYPTRLDGEETREKLLAAGYSALTVDNIDSDEGGGETGPVMAAFRSADLHVLARVNAGTAMALRDWMAAKNIPTHDGALAWPRIELWLEQHRSCGRRTFADLVRNRTQRIEDGMPELA